SSERHIHLFYVLFDHSAGAESGCHRANRLLDNAHPAHWNTSVVAAVEGRDDLFFEQAINGLGFRSIVFGFARIDEPAVRLRVPFSPPPTRHPQMGHAVNGRLHSARTARFERFTWIVEPYIASLNEKVSNVEVVFVDEGNPPRESQISGAAV